MAALVRCLLLSVALLLVELVTADVGGIDGVLSDAAYKRREHCLSQPYFGSGMDIPFWEFGGSTVVTSNYVRLTPDRQSKRGFLWNAMPFQMHNWMVMIEFRVHGQAKHLFGDGFAFWYTKDRGTLGPVFGSSDYFTGLGIFFDTYSNHNGEHKHDHPYISAMVNNGTLHYDHDRDGTHSEMSGCTVKFRNPKYDTFVSISYAYRILTVMAHIDENKGWVTCFTVEDVDLPTGYYMGFSAATGDLADNHDIISVRSYDLDETVSAQQQAKEQDWANVVPQAKNAEPPRAHVADVRPWFGAATYQSISIVLLILLVVGILAVIGGMAFLNNQTKSRKRFF